jgi:hypothetical protein
VKELNETRIWLKIIVRSELMPVERLEDLWMNAISYAGLSVQVSKQHAIVNN